MRGKIRLGPDTHTERVENKKTNPTAATRAKKLARQRQASTKIVNGVATSSKSRMERKKATRIDKFKKLIADYEHLGQTIEFSSKQIQEYEETVKNDQEKGVTTLYMGTVPVKKMLEAARKTHADLQKNLNTIPIEAFRASLARLTA